MFLGRKRDARLFRALQWVQCTVLYSTVYREKAQCNTQLEDEVNPKVNADMPDATSNAISIEQKRAAKKAEGNTRTQGETERVRSGRGEGKPTEEEEEGSTDADGARISDQASDEEGG